MLKGPVADRQKDVSLFLDETGLPATAQRDSSRLKKIKPRIFIDEELTPNSRLTGCTRKRNEAYFHVVHGRKKSKSSLPIT